MVLALKRSAYSTNIKTRSDFSCAFFDASVPLYRSGVCAAGAPRLDGRSRRAARRPRLWRRPPRSRRRPADATTPTRAALTSTTSRLISPGALHDGRLFGYVANLAHHVDVGGGAPASVGTFREVYQEGIIIPPVKLVAGRTRSSPDVFRLVLAQIRSQARDRPATSGASPRSPPTRPPASVASRHSSKRVGRRRHRRRRSMHELLAFT